MVVGLVSLSGPISCVSIEQKKNFKQTLGQAKWKKNIQYRIFYHILFSHFVEKKREREKERERWEHGTGTNIRVWSDPNGSALIVQIEHE